MHYHYVATLTSHKTVKPCVLRCDNHWLSSREEGPLLVHLTPIAAIFIAFSWARHQIYRMTLLPSLSHTQLASVHIWTCQGGWVSSLHLTSFPSFSSCMYLQLLLDPVPSLISIYSTPKKRRRASGPAVNPRLQQPPNIIETVLNSILYLS